MYYDTNEATMMNKCTSSASHFDGYGGEPEQYRRHRPMWHVQGYSGSHLMPPLVDYSLRITPAAARATANKMMTKKLTKKTGHYICRGGVPVLYRAHCPIEEVQGFTRSHWMLPLGKHLLR